MNWRYGLIAACAACLAMLLWAGRQQVPLLSNLEGQLVDAQARFRGPLPPGTPISILLIDDKSLEEIGTIPIDRKLVAQSIHKLKAAGARLIAFDMLFVEHAHRAPEADRALAEAIQTAGNVIIPFALSADGERGPPPPLPDRIADEAFTHYQNDEARRYMGLMPQRALLPLPEFAQRARGLGHVSALPDRDGGLRYDFPALWYQDELLPSMALKVAQLARGTPIEAKLGKEIRLGTTNIPLDAASRQWVNYYGASNTFHTASFADLLAGRLDPSLFKDKIVLIGDTALGNSDRHASPFDPALPGVERIATIVDNILTERWLNRPDWAPLAEIAAMILLPLCAAMLANTFSGRVALGCSLLIFGLLTALAQWAFNQQGIVLSLIFPVIALGLATVGSIAHRAWNEERQRRTAENALRASEARYALAAKGTNDGLWDWDLDSNRMFFSERWKQLMGLDPSAPIEHIDDWVSLLDQMERQRFQAELDAHLQGRSGHFHHIFRFSAGNTLRWMLARGIAVREPGKPSRMAGSLTDITEQKQLEKQIAHDAWHDRLTGLPNRDLFNERLKQRFGSPSIAAEGVGLVMLDIDNFRSINEQFGQFAGNALLNELSRRLKETADEHMLVARLGSDQFAIAYFGPENPVIAEGIQTLFQTPFHFNETPYTAHASIGWAHSAQGIDSPDDLQNAANLALVHSKTEGGSKCRRFDPAEQALEKSRRWLHENIDKALAEGNQFKLYYQPFVRLADRRLIGFEALIRWEHPEKGFMFPNDFIPYAEESGQINEIGRWTLYQAARDLKSWENLGFEGEVAVNLSGRQFNEQDLVAECRTLLNTLAPIPPKRFKLEVTESMAMSNPQKTTDTLIALADMGFKISIDDFGTGYSSLAYLHRFPFDTLKIDRSFVIRLDAGLEAREIVRTIAGLGKSLNKQILAEGVEEESQAYTLETLGVDTGQGWLFAKALSYADATTAIRTDQARQPPYTKPSH